MGNCQAAEVSAVVIQNPSGTTHKVQRLYWSVSASDVMSANPGHYVAMVVTSPTLKNENDTPMKQLKLLRPDDTLLVGHVYRLVSFEDVLKEFTAKKCVKLGRLLRDSSAPEKKKKASGVPNHRNPGHESDNSSSSESQGERDDAGDGGEERSGSFSDVGVGGSGSYVRRYHGGRAQWRPALESIAEFGI